MMFSIPNRISRFVFMPVAAAFGSDTYAAVDSYRFMHVTISTPWYIFLFLLMGVFAPFVLMVILAWRNAVRKSAQEEMEANQGPSAGQ